MSRRPWSSPSGGAAVALPGPAVELRVRALRLLSGGGSLRESAADARRTWDRRRGVLLCLETDEGTSLGEATPLPGASADDVTAASRALDHARDALVGSTIRLTAEDDALDVVSDVAARALAPIDSPAARFALETALLDALGRASRTSMASLLGAAPGSEVEISALLGDPCEPGAIERAVALTASGARTIKLKLGASGVDADGRAVRALRAALGPSITLIGDANGAWDLEEARVATSRLAASDVALVEQPVSPELFSRLGALDVPVWADESLTELDTRSAVVALPWLGGIACKPTLLGGLHATRTLARAAASRGLGVALTHALEGPVALAACAALALALVDLAPRAGLWPHVGLGAWPDMDPAVRGPRLLLPSAPGLGLGEEERARLLELPRWRA